MGNADSKREFITQLFLYYKPLLSKEKQIQLLFDWMESCVNAEEYEMASTLKGQISNIEGGIDEEVESKLKVLKIPESVEKPSILPIKPPKKTKKGWKYVNKWEEKYGFTLFECEFSLKKRRFSLMLLNYGITYGI